VKVDFFSLQVELEHALKRVAREVLRDFPLLYVDFKNA